MRGIDPARTENLNRGRSAAAENSADDDARGSGKPQYLPGVIPDELIGGIDRAPGLVGDRQAGIDHLGLGLAQTGFEIRSGLCELVGAGRRSSVRRSSWRDLSSSAE